MTDIQGALGSKQMDRAEMIQERRVARAKRYDSLLAQIDWLRTPHTPAGCEHGYQSYVCIFQPERLDQKNIQGLHSQRNALMTELEAHGIATRQGTHAVVSQSYYAGKYGIDPDAFPEAVRAELLSLSLPLYPQMTDEEQDYVVEQLLHAYSGVPCAG